MEHHKANSHKLCAENQKNMAAEIGRKVRQIKIVLAPNFSGNGAKRKKFWRVFIRQITHEEDHNISVYFLTLSMCKRDFCHQITFFCIENATFDY